jgi:hypothetical protein
MTRGQSILDGAVQGRSRRFFTIKSFNAGVLVLLVDLPLACIPQASRAAVNLGSCGALIADPNELFCKSI